MGLFGDIAGAVVMKYKADTKEAEAQVKALSGVQKKAAKEAAEAHKAAGEAFERNVQQFAKGAAIIGGALLVANSGLKAMREESRLTAGASGVDIDRLSDSFGGLKTRMEVLTIAQAGHQGAWKLTTAQLQLVADGMRALEKKGYDAQQVMDKFTDVLKKGKTEGLDDFGISIKSTGDKTQDLKILMQALGKEVSDVGGNFAKAGDEAQRSFVKMEDGLTRLRVLIGKVIDGLTEMASSFGQEAGSLAGGNLNYSDFNDYQFDWRQYVMNFAEVRQGRALTPIGKIGSAAAFTAGGANGADAAAAQALAAARSKIRKANIGVGALATASTIEIDEFLATLPQNWQKVDPVLAAIAQNVRDKAELRMVEAGRNAAAAFKDSWARGLAQWNQKQGTPRRGSGRSRGRSGSAVDTSPTVFDDILGTAGGFYDFAMGQAAANDAAFASDRNDYAARMSQRFSDAQTIQDLTAFQANFAKEQEQSFLERTFGKLEEFDQYAAGFATLKGAVQDGFAAWISGSESLGTAVKKSIAQSLAAYAVEMSGKALVAGAEAIFYLAQGNFASATAMGLSAAKYAAAAGTLGYLAKTLGGDAKGGGAAASAAGVPGRPAANGNAGNHGVVIVGDPLSDDSPRERARRVRRAMRSAGRDAEGVTYG